MEPFKVIEKCAKQFEMHMARGMKIAAEATVKRFKKNYDKAGIKIITGELKDSIKVKGSNEMEATIIDDAPYAIYVNDGTDKMPARPYFIADDKLTHDIIKAIEKEVNKGF